MDSSDGGENVSGRRWCGAFAGLFAPVSLAGLFAFMLAAGWRRWCDPLVDFGRELYLPWRMFEGEVLYRDIPHLFGPFSKYLFLFVFKLSGGASLDAVFFTNALILAGFLILLHRLAESLAGRVGAWWCVALVTVLCCLGAAGMGGNYNFIAPYAHELVHGLILSFGVLYMLLRENGRYGMLFWAGAVAGLAFLTKPEVELSLALAACAFFFAPPALGHEGWGGAFARAARFALGFAATFAAAFGLLSFYGGAGVAFAALTEQWRVVLFSEASRSPFYILVRGFDDLPGNLWAMLSASGAFLMPFALAWWSALSKWRGAVLALGLSAAALAASAVLSGQDLPRVFPLVDFAALAFFLWRYRETGFREDLFKALFALFALAMLAKTGVAPGFVHYGFVLSLPSLALVAIMLFGDLPSVVARRGGNAKAFHRAITFAALALLAGGVYQSNFFYSARKYRVGTEKEYFHYQGGLAGRRAESVDLCVKWILKNTKGGDTLAVYPDGAMVNYLTRRPNPTGYISLMPIEASIYGEKTILESLKAAPPALVVVPLVDLEPEYGVNNVGAPGPYAKAFFDWLSEGYFPAAKVELLLDGQKTTIATIYRGKG